MVERKTLNLVVVGSSPTVGDSFFCVLLRARSLLQTTFCDPRARIGAVTPQSRLAQLVERKTLNLVVVGSSPTVGEIIFIFLQTYFSQNKK